MGLGISIFLFAVGAILAWGVTVQEASAFDLNTIGAILMVVAGVGFLMSLVFWSTLGFGSRERETFVERDSTDHHHHRAA